MEMKGTNQNLNHETVRIIGPSARTKSVQRADADERVEGRSRSHDRRVAEEIPEESNIFSETTHKDI